MRARNLCKGLACLAMIGGLVACGGGGAPSGATAGAAGGGGGGAGNAAATPSATVATATAQQLQVQPRLRGAKVSGSAGAVLALYQALYGKAPSNVQFNSFISQADANLGAFAVAQAAGLSALSDSAVATQVMANMNLSVATLGQANYDLLHDIIIQLLGVYGPPSRGIIVLNLTNILAALEGDPTWGAAATGFNAQVLYNFNYSNSTAATATQAVTVPRLYTGQAQGLYNGTLGLNYTLSLLMLENDEAYAIYGQISGTTYLVYGMVHIDGAATVSAYASANVRDYAAGGTVFNDTMVATYSPATTFTGSMLTSVGTVNFSTVGVPASFYNYNAPAQLASITGAWPGALLSGASGTLNIAANGSFSSTLSGCAFSGTLVPRPSGKNVFNLSASFGGAPCTQPGKVVSGVAMSYTNAAGQKQLLMAMTTTDREQGSAFVAYR